MPHNDMGTTRLFFALLPDRETQSAIQWHATQLSPNTGKPVKPDNYHITLKFLGNVDHRTAEGLCMDCDEIDISGFELSITRAGWWNKAKILWLAPESIPSPLSELAKQLDNLASKRKLPAEKKAYFPHITIMRKVAEAPQQPTVKPFTWQAHAFCLMQSFTRPEGAKYTEVARWPLAD